MRLLVISLVAAIVATVVPGAHAQTRSVSQPAAPRIIQALSAPPVSPTEAIAATIEMYVGESRVLPYPRLAQIAVGAQKVLSAAGVQGREILLFANEPGEATLHVWTTDGRMQRLKVVVRGSDLARVNTELAALLHSIPTASTRIVGDRIVVQGENLADQDQAQIKLLADKYPQIVDFTGKLGWERMIEMEVRVVEITTDKARQLGVAWDSTTAGPTVSVAGDIHHNHVYTPIITSPGAAPSGDQSAVRATTPFISPFHSYFGIWSILNSQINLLEQQGDAIVIARPRLVTRNGAQAEFQVGGQIPYPTVSELGQTSVLFKDYGVILKVQPRVDSTGTIRATINAEVSEPDTSLSVNGQPGLLVRKVSSEFNVREGQTMILGGMLRRNYSANRRRVPGLGSIPIIGELFTNRSKSDVTTETIVFVTPRIVVPGGPDALPEAQGVIDRAETIIAPPPDPPVPPRDDDPAFYTR